MYQNSSGGMELNGNILCVGDTHIPFCKVGYLEFCKEVQERYQCDEIIHIGDLVDFHSISRFDHDPSGLSPKDELTVTLEELKEWYKKFPKCTVLIGNHDERIERAAIRAGLAKDFFKSFEDLLEFPEGWVFKFDYYKHGVRFFHGMGYGGKYAHQAAAIENGQSTVMGHLHSNAGTMWSAGENNIIFGLAVGCGIDRHTYAFKYGRDMRRKPIIGCGVVLNYGKEGFFVPMSIDEYEKDEERESRIKEVERILKELQCESPKRSR